VNLDTILLAMLGEPATGYDLKAAFNLTANHFWPAELSQIYRTLKRLEQEGRLKSRVEPSDRGPERRVYRLTAAGRKHLHETLADEPQFTQERLPYIAQLFFLHELDDLRATRVFVESVRATREKQLAVYRGIAREYRSRFGGSLDDATDEQFHHYLTLEAGIRIARARLQWCDEAIERIDRRIARGKK
jgi:DNA-binding PadR family transcriptional regulator